MKQSSTVANSWFARLLRLLAGAVCRYPRWFVFPQFILFAACIYFTAFSSHHLQMDMDRDDLVGSDKGYHKVFMDYRKEFPGEDELAVVVESNDHQRNRQFVERLAAKVALETNLFTDVFYKGDLKSLGPKALLFVPDKDLEDLRNTLLSYGPFIQKFTDTTNLDSLFNLINQQIRTAKREENAENTSLINAIPALERIITEANTDISRPGTPVSPGVTALFGSGDEVESAAYITFANGRIFLVTARAKSEDLSADAVLRMRQLISETEFEVPGLNVGLTGEPVLDFDEMQASEHDAILATLISLVVSALIFGYAYREATRPLKTVLCLIVGLGYSMAFTTLVIGHLNILTITFAPILIGLAIDFGIHFISRFEEEIRHGRGDVVAVEKAIVFTGQGIITGGLTTSGAFLAMWLTNFKGIQEMGVISGGGLILCLIPMMTLLPVLLMGSRNNVAAPELIAAEEAKRARIERSWLRRPGVVVGVVAALCALATSQLGKVYFDYNLLDMQSKGLPSVVYEKKLLYSGESILYVALVADSLEQARQYELAVKQLSSVASVDGDDKGESVYDILTSDPSAKLKLVREIKQDVSQFHFPPDLSPPQMKNLESGVTGADPETNPLHPRPADINSLGTTLWQTMGYLGLIVDETATNQPDVAKPIESLRQAITAFRVNLFSGDPAIPERVAMYQKALLADVRETFEALQNQDTSSGLKPSDLPPALRSRFIGQTGKYRVLVFPKKDIWQRANQAEFINQLRSKIPPDRVTGTPVQLLEYETLLKDSYEQAALYALGAIALMVLWQFRSFLCVLLALFPVAIGTVWLVGIMGRFDIPFNPADIMTLPLVIGIGVTNGIHILNRFAEEQTAAVLARSTGKAVLVSGLTAMTGFGSLILGRHQGIQSLGLVMSIGIGTCMAAGLTFLPALLNLLVRRGWTLQIKRPGSDNARSLPSPEEPR